MKSRNKILNLLGELVLILTLVFTIIATASAQTTFFDDFEGGLSQWEGSLSQWVGKDGAAHNGVIVEDPLRPGNNVLTFKALNLGGDIFGTDVAVAPGQKSILSFEYLGIPCLGGNLGDLGGFIGFTEHTVGPARHRWLAGTELCCGNESDPLIDDGQWRSYSLEFNVFECGLPGQNGCFTPITPPSNNTIQVMLEEFTGSAGVAGDVFFDNIRLTVEPRSVVIDIKPGNKHNAIDPRSNGDIWAAILSDTKPESLFDPPSQADISTIEFGPGHAKANRHKVKDTNKDGVADLLLRFKISESDISCGDTEATLTGETFGGLSLAGTGAVKTVGCKPIKHKKKPHDDDRDDDNDEKD